MTSGSPDWSPRIVSSASADEQKKVDVSDVDSTGTFANMMLSILVYNDGPNAVHYNRDAVATTDNFKIPAKSWLMIDVPTNVVHFICADDETATIYCLGVY